MLDPVTANFLGDNLRCWMQIQVIKLEIEVTRYKCKNKYECKYRLARVRMPAK